MKLVKADIEALGHAVTVMRTKAESLRMSCTPSVRKAAPDLVPAFRKEAAKLERQADRLTKLIQEARS